jgi:hypothetical protein
MALCGGCVCQLTETARFGGYDQRESMGVLEYRAMPTLRDVL